MISVRWMAGLSLGALVAAGVAVAPALQAREGAEIRRIAPALTSMMSIDSFTPAAADPKLAEVLAHSGMANSDFRFTPSESARPGSSRAVTVAVRTNSRLASAKGERSGIPTQAISVAPIAYNLGTSVGWRRFAVSGDATRVDLVPSSGADRSDLSAAFRTERTAPRTRTTSAAVVDTPAKLVADAPAATSIGTQPQKLDVGGSYSLTRNIDVTAGVRYERSERDRLPRLTDDRRDSQAVYVGTAFRF